MADVNFGVPKNPKSITYQVATPWYQRIWFFISNPFYYIFKGKMRL